MPVASAASSDRADAAGRLDVTLVARGLVSSRARGLDLIRRGAVAVDGVVETKAGQKISARQVVVVDDRGGAWVSRGAEKLVAALDHFGIDPSGLVALDVGASTGGFCQVLLQRGAARVFAVDVGRDQLHPTLVSDPRVVNCERTDARLLTADRIDAAIEILVADVSFISLTKALPVSMTFVVPGGVAVVLVKPQFEAGRAAVGKGGIVRSPLDRDRAVAEVRDFFAANAWAVLGTIASPITGGDGNAEFLLAARKS